LFSLSLSLSFSLPPPLSLSLSLSPPLSLPPSLPPSLQQENPYGSERVVSSKLPQDRTSYDKDSFDQITSSTEGYLTAQEVLEIFSKRATDSAGEWTEQRIAKDYKISPEDAVNLVKYFGSYRVMGALEKRQPEMKLHPLHR
jgi:hypothetical protein